MNVYTLHIKFNHGTFETANDCPSFITNDEEAARWRDGMADTLYEYTVTLLKDGKALKSAHSA